MTPSPEQTRLYPPEIVRPALLPEERRAPSYTLRLVAALCGALLASVLSGCNQTSAAQDDVARRPQIGAPVSTPREVTSAHPAQALPATLPQGGVARQHAALEAAQADAGSALLAQESASAPKPAPRALPHDGARVYAKTRNVWVRERPSHDSQWIGFLWFGDSARLKNLRPLPGRGCSEGWYAVEPRGYVCVDGERSTLDADDPVLQALFPLGPNPEVALPHPHYGESRGAPRYRTLPTPEAQSFRERDLKAHMAALRSARNGEPPAESLQGVDVSFVQNTLALPSLPRTLQMDHKWLRPTSTVAWTREVSWGERMWLLTEDLTWVPKDRVVPYPAVMFHGVHLSDEVRLPLAFFRGKSRPRYELHEGELREKGHYPRLGHVQLTGQRIEQDDRVMLETTDGGWVASDDAVVVEARPKTPWGTPLAGPEDAQAGTGLRRWLDVSLLGGYLVAYEGHKPMFATMISPGRGGAPHGNIPTLKTASTPTGRFKITGKFVTSAMISPTKMVHSAVPYAQNFSGPYSLHSAYWHNDWGEPKSGGCINLAPIDAKWLFDFTEPALPPGWHGVRWLPKHEAATTLIVRR